MNNSITAQELKTKGTKILSEKTKIDGEAFITLRGENKFVVLTVDKYDSMRESELELAFKQAQDDISQGKFKVKNASEHVKDLKDV